MLFRSALVGWQGYERYWPLPSGVQSGLQVIADGTPADLIDRLGGHHVVEFSVSGNHAGAALPAWRALPSVESVRDEEGLIALNVKQPHLTIPALLGTIDKQGGELQHLTTRQASLEDVFVRLTGRHLREQ